jgi:hypothetical protein
MPLILSGDTGPSIVPASALPAGSVIQVVQNYLEFGVSTTSGTAVTTGLTATITPRFSTSKILVSIFANGVQKVAGNGANGVILWVYKNGSNLQRIGEYIGYTNSSLTNDIGSAGINYLDSPATTSATTYTLFFGSNVSGQVVYINAGGDYSTITLMEIQA